jgi:hypothetical protein
MTSREPDLTTDPALFGVLEELRAREPICHRPEFGTTRADFAAQMSEDFWEVGASGRRYNREFVLETLEEKGRLTRRLTIWRRVAGSWKALYHQGTVVAE